MPRIRASDQILESKAHVERQLKDGSVEPYARIRIPIARGGADLIKIRTVPDFDTLHAAIDEAHRQGIRLAAHSVAPPEKLLEAKLDSVAHFLSIPALTSIFGQERDRLFKSLAQGGLFMSTTLTNIDNSILISYEQSKLRLDDPAGKVDFRRKYVCGYLVDDWREQIEEKKEEPYRDFPKLLPALLKDLKGLHAAGVPFLAGTDVAVAFMYPGFSLHDELALLVRDLGFSPMEALRAATHNPTLFFRNEKALGAMQPGLAADLVLLDADPLADIQNTKRIYGVMLRGRWLDRPSLDRMLKSVEKSAQTGCKAESAVLN